MSDSALLGVSSDLPQSAAGEENISLSSENQTAAAVNTHGHAAVEDNTDGEKNIAGADNSEDSLPSEENVASKSNTVGKGNAANEQEFLSPFEKIASWIDTLQMYWSSSLRLRVASIILVGGLFITALVGVLITSQLSSTIFQQTTDSYVEQFSIDANNAQSNFSASAAPTSGQTQQAANDLVAKMYDPNRGLLGSVLIRSAGQAASANQIVEPASSATLRDLITPELKRAVANSRDVAWQSIELPLPESGKVPGVIMGTSIYISNSGDYEFYAVFSLETQQTLLQTVQRVLAGAMLVFDLLIGLLTYAVMRLVLRPVREASRNAQYLADGEFDTRMEVKGNDELAQLAKSFNQMAISLEDQFTKLERMSALQTNFVSAVSHELRSPVTTMRMAGQLIYDKRDELPPLLKRSAELQHDQVINLESMLVDLLEISRYDAGAMTLSTEETDLSVLVRKIVQVLEPLAIDNGVIVRMNFAGEMLAEVDARRIQRIVRNLVVNALEHAEGKPVTVNIVGNETAVAVEVRDRGVGLSDEQAAHVFDRFWRADTSRVRKTGGTGLGLTIAREDALLHGGLLEAAGTLGAGAVFLLTVPKKPGAPFVQPIQLSKPDPVPELDSEIAVAQVQTVDQQQATDLPQDSADANIAGDAQVPDVAHNNAEVQVADGVQSDEVEAEISSQSEQCEESEAGDSL